MGNISGPRWSAWLADWSTRNRLTPRGPILAGRASDSAQCVTLGRQYCTKTSQNRDIQRRQPKGPSRHALELQFAGRASWCLLWARWFEALPAGSTAAAVAFLLRLIHENKLVCSIRFSSRQLAKPYICKITHGGKMPAKDCGPSERSNGRRSRPGCVPARARSAGCGRVVLRVLLLRRAGAAAAAERAAGSQGGRTRAVVLGVKKSVFTEKFQS